MTHVTFILFPEFQMLAYVLASETLRIANKCASKPVFTWQTLTSTNAPAYASNGALVAPDATEWTNTEKPDLLLLCAGYRPLDYLTARVRAYLSRLVRTDCVIGGVDTGTVLLAQLGLLNGHTAVLHYEAEAEFRDTWPHIELVDQIFCLSGKRMTTAGGTAMGDAMLAWIARDVDKPLAQITSKGIIHGVPRRGETSQRDSQIADPHLLKMRQLMETHLAEPLSISAICEELGLSIKQLRQKCVKKYKQTPSHYYQSCRLEVAKHLIINTSQSMTEIATRCGFISLSSFSRAFRSKYNLSPRQLRSQLFA